MTTTADDLWERLMKAAPALRTPEGQEMVWKLIDTDGDTMKEVVERLADQVVNVMVATGELPEFRAVIAFALQSGIVLASEAII